MEKDLILAKEELLKGEYTCVFCKDGVMTKSAQRGVAYLLDLLDKKMNFEGFCVADKVVGKGAAVIYLLLKVKAVYAPVLSQGAKAFLEDNNIEVYFDECPELIMNRDQTGYCPIELAVKDISSCDEAIKAIRKKLKELS